MIDDQLPPGLKQELRTIHVFIAKQVDDILLSMNKITNVSLLLTLQNDLRLLSQPADLGIDVKSID
jgi:hypothetical protein